MRGSHSRRMVWQCGVRPDARLMNFLRRNRAMSEPTIHEVSKDLTRPREQMDTHQAKYESALDRFRADMERFRTDTEKSRADMEKFRADLAQRESNRMQWLIGMWIGGVLVTIAALGIFIRLAI